MRATFGTMEGQSRINGAALRVIRERSGLSIGQLSILAGVHKTHVSRLERGMRGASPETALAIARALKCPVVALLGGEQ